MTNHTILYQLNSITLSKYGDNFILWITHDKDYHFGWYYLIKDDKLYLVYDTETTYEEHLVKDFNNDR